MRATYRAIRVHLGMSIADAAKKIGMPKSRLRAIEKHEAEPTMQTAMKMMKVYDVASIDDMLFCDKERHIILFQKGARSRR